MIRVRTAVPGDGAFLWRTTRSLAESHNHLGQFEATPESFERNLFCENPVIGALIAEWDGQGAGSVVWHRSFSTDLGREVMYLEDIIVLPEFQKRGIARALMKETAKVALARGYDAVFWLMMEWNDAARKLYDSVGAEYETGVNVCRIRRGALEALAR